MKEFTDVILSKITNLNNKERNEYFEWFGRQNEVLISRIMSKYIPRYYALIKIHKNENNKVIEAAALLQAMQIYYVADLQYELDDLSQFWFTQHYLDETRSYIQKIRGTLS